MQFYSMFAQNALVYVYLKFSLILFLFLLLFSCFHSLAIRVHIIFLFPASFRGLQLILPEVVQRTMTTLL